MKTKSSLINTKLRFGLLTGLLVLAACSPGIKYTETSTPVDENEKRVVIAANGNYEKVGRVHRFWLGEHFRKEWATPVAVDILYLDSLKPGLTPVRLGGGNQTKSLRLQGGDGKQYVLRSVNKDPSKALPEEFVGTFADDIVQDQISSSNPYAPMVVAELMGSAGIYHSTPRMVYVKGDSTLGEFKEAFNNSLCLFEERPYGSQENNPEFGFAKNIINSEKLFEKIAESSDHRVDEQAFLRARLFDLWIGDWDRHEDQYVWAAFKEGNQTLYRPIPRDRDQAFSNLDGIIPTMASQKWAVRKTQNFDYTIKDVIGLAQIGNYLDRQFTTRLTLQDWKALAAELQVTLSDEKIEKAFSQMPEQIRQLSADVIIAKLKQRRNDLVHYAMVYYQFLSQEVNVVGSDSKERFEVSRMPDSLVVRVFGKTGKKSQRDTLYYRAFFPSQTKEVRLYGLGGDDEFVVTGSVDKSILVRIMGGKGGDSVRDESHVRGLSHRTMVYDQKMKLDVGTETKVFVTSDSLKTTLHRKQYRFDLLAPKLTPGFNPDDGLFLGGGFTFKKQSFGKAPYGQLHSAWGNYAFRTGAYNFHYNGIFKEAVGRWDLVVNTQVQAPSFIYNYYGQGNETEVMQGNLLYHRVRMNQLGANILLQKSLGERTTFSTGLLFQSTRVQKSEDRFISSVESGLDSSDYERHNYTGVQSKFNYTTVDNPLNPSKGIAFSVSATYFQPVGTDGNANGQLAGEFSFYKTFGRLTIANRFGGATLVADDYEFYQSVTLGGTENLRGYRRTRFSGKSSLYHNTELRMALGQRKAYFLRGTYGLLLFHDTGRVWVPGEDSKKWHSGYGGGLWFAPYGKVSFTATYGISSENQLLTIGAGFQF
ncbi:MAG: BamA/TamA family outer membrane protein [Cyclobacteriaceae bacterium]|nr:BamA/TamA family outer membrane protein [Cyclobacteriaceae bacterium]